MPGTAETARSSSQKAAANPVRPEKGPEIRSAVDYVVPRRFEAGATGKPSQIIKLEVDGQVQILRA